MGKQVQARIKQLRELDEYKGYGKYYGREGDGPKRLGSNLKPKPDLYSMLFVATFHAEYIYDLQKKKNHKERIMQELIKKRQNNQS